MGDTMSSWPFTDRSSRSVGELISRTRPSSSSHAVPRADAMRHSAVWACLRLRADLISTMPLDVYRASGGAQVEQVKPSVLLTPGGSRVRMVEHLYSSQIDLDSCGNSFGIIRARDGIGLPARIDLVPADDVKVRSVDGEITVTVGRKTYPYADIWHEKQYTMSGLVVGLSPLAYSAMTISTYLSAQQFASDWFGNSAVPASHLRNTSKSLKPGEAAAIKQRFKASISSGDVFVTGSDWEYSMLAAKASETQYLEQMSFSVADVCRFLGVPGDMIDAEKGSSSITYANITQRNLQLLITNLGPAITRREEAMSYGLLPAPRYVRFNTDALLRMDQKSRYESYGIALDKKFLAPSEVRDLENRPPFTAAQEAEFARLSPAKPPSIGATQ